MTKGIYIWQSKININADSLKLKIFAKNINFAIFIRNTEIFKLYQTQHAFPKAENANLSLVLDMNFNKENSFGISSTK